MKEHVESYSIDIETKEYLNTLVDLSEGIFHDFKNILATISGLSQLTALETRSSEVKENLYIINQSSLEGRKIIERFYNIVKGYNIEERDYACFGTIILSALDMVKHRINIPIYDGKEIELSLNLNSLDKVFCNEYKMRQAILNIVLNALDAMEENGGILEINLFEKFGTVILEISDTGPGILEENLDKIFQSNFTTKGDQGTGLGLRISKDIFKEYGGEILVESKLGVGTKFIINFPILEENSVDI